MQVFLWLIILSVLPNFSVERGISIESVTSVKFMDFNNDGHVDILVAQDNLLSIFQGDGEGNFVELSQIPAPHLGDFAVLDFNGDGFLDVAIIQNSSVLSVFKNKGVEGFSRIYEHSLTGNRFRSLSVIDFNRDGLLDLYVSGPVSGDVIFLSEGGFEFVPMAVSFMSEEVVPLSCHRNVVSYLLLSKNGIKLAEKSKFLPVQTIFLKRGKFKKVFPADLNNDGNYDLITLDEEGNLRVFTGLEDSVFSLESVLDFDVADFDLDSHMDVVVLFNDNSVAILENKGNFSFELNNYLTLSESVHRPTEVYAVDLNSDYLADLVFYNGSNFEIAYNLGVAGRMVGITLYPVSNAWLSRVKLFDKNGIQSCVFRGQTLIFGVKEKIDSVEILWPDSTRFTVYDIKPDTFYSFNTEMFLSGERETTEDTGYLKLYPNPTSALVSLEYTLDKPCFVKLELINTGGQTLYLIDSGYKDSGVHRLIFNAEDFRPGTYFIRAVIGDKSIRKKLIVLK